MDTRGQHLLLDLWLAEELTNEKAETICELVQRLFQVVQESHWEFHPQGMTKVFILSESHFTIHTYPEHRFLSLDLYVCDTELNLLQVKEEILGLFKLRHANHKVILRGHRDSFLEAAPNNSLPDCVAK